MATLTVFEHVPESLAENKYNWATDQFVVLLSNAANPPSASADVKDGDFTEIAYTNLSSRNITTTSSGQTSGLYKLILEDLVLTATGDVAAFQYVTIADSTATNFELIGFYDYASEIELHNGDTFTVNFDGTNGFLQISIA